MVGLERGDPIGQLQSRGHGEATEVVDSATNRRDEVREAPVRYAVAMLPLLPQVVDRGPHLCRISPAVVGRARIDHDVVARRVSGP